MKFHDNSTGGCDVVSCRIDGRIDRYDKVNGRFYKRLIKMRGK
jgi:hypothetical protein